MSFLSAAERFAAIDHSEVVLDAQQCLHSHDQFSACEACFEICPVDAIQPGKPPALDTDKCQDCLACLPVCPVGAYSADDAVQSLLTCATRLETKTVELICASHGSAEMGLSAESIGILLRGCLAGLGAGTYVALAAIGLEHIVLRVDACANCPWVSLQDTIRSQVEQANQFLSHWDKRDILVCVSEINEQMARPLWDAKNPPLSRRDLFRMAAKQGQIAMARAMEQEYNGSKRRPGRDRLRLIHAVNHLPKPEKFLDIPMEDGNFTMLSVSSECNACAACVKACPTESLKFHVDEEKTHYWLSFDPRTCIGCGLCAHVCAPKAIELEEAPTFAQIFSDTEPCTLSAGSVRQCVQCKTLFATDSDQNVCPVCAYRKKNPFGAMMPPGINVAATRSKGKNIHDS